MLSRDSFMFLNWNFIVFKSNSMITCSLCLEQYKNLCIVKSFELSGLEVCNQFYGMQALKMMPIKKVTEAEVTYI